VPQEAIDRLLEAWRGEGQAGALVLENPKRA
jgi:hypothetical protein